MSDVYPDEAFLIEYNGKLFVSDGNSELDQKYYKSPPNKPPLYRINPDGTSEIIESGHLSAQPDHQAALVEALKAHHEYQKELEASGYGNYSATTLCRVTAAALEAVGKRGTE